MCAIGACEHCVGAIFVLHQIKNIFYILSYVHLCVSVHVSAAIVRGQKRKLDSQGWNYRQL